LLVGGGELQVLSPRRARLQQLDLDLADTAADLQDAGTVDADRLQKLRHLPRGLIESPLAVPVGQPAGEPLVEEAVVVAGGTAACHAGECSGASPGQGTSTLARAQGTSPLGPDRGLQWVIDGYTLTFAALLFAGSLSDGSGAGLVPSRSVPAAMSASP
jgi:hypothetical protein